jgi:hypothetical protein
MPSYCLESGSHDRWLRSSFFAAVILALACTSTVDAADDPVKIRLAALVEEGDILSQEAANLVPETKRVKLEGDKIVASERSLLEQSNALTKAFAQYNADLAQQREVAKDWPDRCRLVSTDAEVKQACDAEATELSAQAAKLEERLAALEARKDALNVRITQHNAARLKWDEHRRKQDARVDVSELDIQRWIDKARSFWDTEGFSLLVVNAGNPSTCARNQQPTSGEQRPADALKRIQQCFKTVKAG